MKAVTMADMLNSVHKVKMEGMKINLKKLYKEIKDEYT